LQAEVYPNPATEKATLKFISMDDHHYHIELMNLIGQHVFYSEGFATEGVNTVELDLSLLAKEVYMLRLVSGGFTDEIKVVVQ